MSKQVSVLPVSLLMKMGSTNSEFNTYQNVRTAVCMDYSARLLFLAVCPCHMEGQLMHIDVYMILLWTGQRSKRILLHKQDGCSFSC